VRSPTKASIGGKYHYCYRFSLADTLLGGIDVQGSGEAEFVFVEAVDYLSGSGARILVYDLHRNVLGRGAKGKAEYKHGENRCYQHEREGAAVVPER
jgi:hypothetical protein